MGGGGCLDGYGADCTAWGLPISVVDSPLFDTLKVLWKKQSSKRHGWTAGAQVILLTI